MAASCDVEKYTQRRMTRVNRNFRQFPAEGFDVLNIRKIALEILYFNKSGGLGVVGSNPAAPTNEEARPGKPAAGFGVVRTEFGCHDDFS